jgi:hypothetical protein
MRGQGILDSDYVGVRLTDSQMLYEAASVYSLDQSDLLIEALLLVS